MAWTRQARRKAGQKVESLFSVWRPKVLLRDVRRLRLEKFFLFLIFLLLVPSAGFSGEKGERAGVRVIVNNVELGVPAFSKGGIVYIPVNALSEVLGARVKWDPLSRELKVNNLAIETSPLIREGALFVPVEAIASALGVPVEWDGAQRVVRMSTGSTRTGLSPVVVEQPPIMPGGSGDDPQVFPKPEIYVPRTASNTEFSVTVTNLEMVKVLKDFYRPASNHKFVVIHVTQQNISDKVQMYSGKFSLVDSRGNSYEYVEGLSNFWLQVLRPGGLNFGSLVFEIPLGASPDRLVLHAYGTPPLSLNLIQ